MGGESVPFPNANLAKAAELLSGASPEHPTTIDAAVEKAGVGSPMARWESIPVEAASAGDVVRTSDGDHLMCLGAGKLVSESGEEFDTDEVSPVAAMRVAE